MLYKTLAEIYLLVIVGPLQITLGTIIPGAGFGQWLKSLIARVLVFPATGTLFYLSVRFVFQSWALSFRAMGQEGLFSLIFPNISKNLFEGELWSPPWLGNAAGASSIAFLLIALMCIMIIPKISKAIASFMSGRAFEFESAIGEVTGPLRTAGGWAAKGATETGIPYGATSLRGYMEKKGIQSRGVFKYFYNALGALERSSNKNSSVSPPEESK